MTFFHKNRKMLSHFKIFTKEMVTLFFSSTFIFLTFIGNGVIILGGILFYHLEKDFNSHVHNLLDGLWWSFSTATTTGYGDITAITTEGRILGILLMLIGMAIFAMYTALFADVILTYRNKNKGF
jgi:voltage-gated potassium channel